MSKVGILIKNEITLFSNRINKMSKNKKTSTLLILVFGVLLVVGILTGQAYLMLDTLKGTGAERMVVDQQIMMLFLFSILFVITNSMTINEKDSDFLLSMPLTKGQIIVSKTLFRFLFNFVISFLILMPVALLYFFMVEAKFTIILLSIATVIVLSITFVGIEYLINSLVNGVAVQFKYFNVVKAIISFVALIGFLVFYFVASFDMADLSAGIPRYPVFSNVADISLKADLVTLFILLGASLLLLALGVYCFSLFYGKKAKTYKTKNYLLKESKSSSVYVSLIKKELKTYFNTPMYLLNTSLGFILIMACPIALFFVDVEAELLKLIAYAFCAFSLSTCSTSSASLSLEGKNFWIFKSAPISYKKIVYSKALTNFLLVLVSSIVMLTITLIANKLPVGFTLLLFLLMLSSGLVVSFVGIVINMLFPKLDFENETAVVKQSASVGISLLSFMVAFMACPIIFIVLSLKAITIDVNLLLAINIAFLLLVFGLSVLFIEKKADKLIAKL